MRDQTIQAVTLQLGEPSSATSKVVRWNVKPGLDVVIQRDASPSRGVVWMPWPGGNSVCPSTGEVYPADRGRHSNTYGAPSLVRGKAALKLNVFDADSLSVVLSRLKVAMANGAVPA